MNVPNIARAHYTQQQYLPSITAPDDSPEDRVPTSDLNPGTLEVLTHPPGLVGSIIDWCEKTSERPSRAAALGAALTFVGALAGRQFASPSDARTNLYITLLAESGFGKDHARKVIKRLASCAGLDHFLPAGRVMSTTALRNSIMKQPAQLLMIDEFHTTMRLINDKRSPFGQLLTADFLECFASAGESFAGAEYAKTPAVTIHNPNLCLYGTTTPDAFWASAGSECITNGFLPRVILFNIEGGKPPHRDPEAFYKDVPSSLISACKAFHVKGDIPWDGSVPRTPRVVPYGPSANAAISELRERVHTAELKADKAQRPFYHRTVEHAVKLALTVAVGVDTANPEISRDVMSWACDLAWYSTQTLIAETHDRVTDNQREADYNRILRLIKESGSNGVTPGIIPDRTRSIDERRRNEILRDLQIGGRIALRQVLTKRGSRDRYFFVH